METETELLPVPEEIAPATAARPSWRRRLLTKKLLFVSILAHLLFASGAAVWVVQIASHKTKRTFQSITAVPNPAQRALEHKVQAKQRKAMSAPVAAKRATTIGPSKFVLPVMPIMPAQATVTAATRITGMGGTGTSMGLGGAGVGTGFGTGGAGIFMASIGGMKVQAKKLAVALDISDSVAEYRTGMEAYVARTFKDSEVATFHSTSFKSFRPDTAGSAMLAFLNSPKNFDSIYVFSDFKTNAKGQEAAWEELKQIFTAKKVRLYLHVLQEIGAPANTDPAVMAAISFAKTSGGSVKIGPMPRM